MSNTDSRSTPDAPAVTAAPSEGASLPPEIVAALDRYRERLLDQAYLPSGSPHNREYGDKTLAALAALESAIASRLRACVPEDGAMMEGERDFRKALSALRLEVPRRVMDDVERRFNAIASRLRASVPTEGDDAERLRSFIRQHAPGGCRVISEGSACGCLLCAVDRLRAPGVDAGLREDAERLDLLDNFCRRIAIRNLPYGDESGRSVFRWQIDATGDLSRRPSIRDAIDRELAKSRAALGSGVPTPGVDAGLREAQRELDRVADVWLWIEREGASLMPVLGPSGAFVGWSCGHVRVRNRIVRATPFEAVEATRAALGSGVPSSGETRA